MPIAAVFVRSAIHMTTLAINMSHLIKIDKVKVSYQSCHRFIARISQDINVELRPWSFSSWVLLLTFLVGKKQLIIMNFRQAPIFLEKKKSDDHGVECQIYTLSLSSKRSGKEAQIPRVGPWNAGSVGGVEGKRTYDNLGKKLGHEIGKWSRNSSVNLIMSSWSHAMDDGGRLSEFVKYHAFFN